MSTVIRDRNLTPPLTRREAQPFGQSFAQPYGQIGRQAAAGQMAAPGAGPAGYSAGQDTAPPVGQAGDQSGGQGAWQWPGARDGAPQKLRHNPMPRQWDWPDPLEVAPPQVTPRSPQTPEVVPHAARWQCDPLPCWPLLGEGEGEDLVADFDPADAGRDEGDDGGTADLLDQGAIPSALYTPQGTTQGARMRPQARGLPDAPAHDAATQAAAQAWTAQSWGQAGVQGVTSHSMGQSMGQSMGAQQAAQSWAAMSVFPEEMHQQVDPSPSRTMYRLNRLWLTPMVRHFVRVGLPILLSFGLAIGWVADETRRADLVAGLSSLRMTLENQPMFQVSEINVESRSPEIAQGVAQMLDITFPISSWQLDLEALRDRAEALDAVDSASLQVRAGVLEVVIEERMPAMIWRNGGVLDLVDAGGHRVARLATRAARPDLPLIAGQGATAVIDEAHALWSAASPLHERLRGLVRIGERRWDVVLDRDQRIMLPARGAVTALEQVLALDMAENLLSLDVQVVDLRNPTRPTLRLSPEAIAALYENRQDTSGAQNR